MMCRGLAGTCSRLFMLLLLVACLNPGVCVTDTTCVADGDSCDDGNACTGPDTCQGGVCLGGSPLPCPGPPNTCTTMGECNPTTGCPSASPLANGTACALSSSTTGTCAGGVCVGYSCGVDGAPCDDGNACTSTDTCQGDACVGGSPLVCPGSINICTQVVSACDSMTGCLSATPLANGTACALSSSTAGTCAGGICVTNSCSPDGAICANGSTTGTCAGGACVEYSCGADGAPCDDGNACTGTDTCQGDACVGGSPLVCSGLISICTQVVSACDSMTGCLTATPLANGTFCVNASTIGTCAGGVCVKYSCGPDGAPCDDGNACTGTDTCHGDECVGGSPLVCPGSINICTQVLSACDSMTGCLSATPLANGTACVNGTTIGTCAGGVCVTTACSPSGAACVNGSTVGTCAGGVCVTGISSPEVLVTFQTEAGDAAEALAIGEAACTDLRVANLTCVVAAKELTARRRLMGTWVVVITVSMNEALTYSAQDLAELGLDLSKGLSEAVTAYFTITKKLDVTSVVVMCGTGFVLVDLTCAAVVRVPAGSGFIQLYVITGLASPRLNV